MTAPEPSRLDARWAAEVLVLAAFYFLTARLGLLFAMPGGHVTPVWPPSGIALAAILLRGQRVWPGIWLGDFTVNFWAFSGTSQGLGGEMLVSSVIGIGGSLAAVVGARLMRMFTVGYDPLERVRDVGVFLALGGMVSCLISATIGATAMGLGGFTPWSLYGQTWLTWWLGDTAGVFVVAPLFLVWRHTHGRKLAGRGWELAACFSLLCSVGYLVFIRDTTSLLTGKPLTFLLMPFLIWPALRFGSRGAAVTVVVIALLAVWGTVDGTGPFNTGSLSEALLVLELFMGVVVLTALCIAAMVRERDMAEAARARVMEELETRVLERTAELRKREQEASAHLAEVERSRAALLSIMEDGRAAEIAMRESEARFRTIVESEPECVKILSPEGDLLEMNAAGLAILECATIEQVRERPLSDWVVEEYREGFIALHRRVIAGGTGRLEFEVIGRAGTRRWLETHGAPLRADDGKVTAFLGVTRDVTVRREADAEIRRSHGQLRELAARQHKVREDEQTRIAREVHDELGQMLTGLKMDLRWLERELESREPGPLVNPLLERAVSASELVNDTVKAVQRIAAQLRPGVLDRLGLSMALRHESRKFAERTGIPCRISAPELEVPAPVATACYRICQESLTNVARHAAATEVTVDFRSAGGAWRLEVSDNGRGITAENRRHSSALGLLGMEERAHQLGGALSIEAGPTGGTIVRLSIPESSGTTETV